MIQAIATEISERKNYLGKENVSTIYFGGGTPGMLNEKELNLILESVYKNYPVEKNAEVTLETNPDDVTIEKLKMWKKSGINRLSIGIQSFYDQHLKWMNRAHNAEQAERSVKDAQQAGFTNITIDLIYGIPGMKPDEWKANLQKAFDLKVNHISAYCLTVEKGTALDHLVKKGKSEPVNDENAAAQFLLLQEEMQKNGFIAYEISNYGKENYFSQHNTSYWKGESYLGAGPSAHSYNKTTRQWNISNNKKYIDAVTGKKTWSETETLTAFNHYNEYIMTSLRTISGINEQHLAQFISGYETEFKNKILAMQNKGWITVNEAGNHILTLQGKLFADKIASEFFLL